MAYPEEKDPRTGKAPRHQAAARKASQDISNAEVKPHLGTYKEGLKWIELKSKKYGGRDIFLASEEYRLNYPAIKKLHDKETKSHDDLASKALKSVNQNYGDKVFYDVVTPFCGVERYEGIIVKRKNLPYVKLNEKTTDGKKFLKWHKGWIAF